MHCEVSTFPAATAAGVRGSRSDPGGITSSSGSRQPSFSGIGRSMSVRNTYSTAAVHTARGALKLCAPSGEVPVKSTRARRRSRSMSTRTAMS